MKLSDVMPDAVAPDTQKKTKLSDVMGVTSAAPAAAPQSTGAAGLLSRMRDALMGGAKKIVGEDVQMAKDLPAAIGQLPAEAARQAEANKGQTLAQRALDPAGMRKAQMVALSANPSPIGKPVIPSANPAAATMKAAGVPLTPGMQGPIRGTFERTISSFPLLRGWVQGGEQRSIDGFDRAVVNQALEPIGAAIPRNIKAGHDLIDAGETALGSAYDRLLPNLTFNRSGLGAITDEMNKIASEMGEDTARRLGNIVKNRVLPKFDESGNMNGAAFKKMEGELSGLARSYAGTSSADLGDGINGLLSHLREQLEVQNPVDAAELRKINSAWAMYTRVRDAAGGATAKGRFTPADLLRAARRQDPTRGRGGFAKGDALMQAFAETGDDVMKGVTLSPLKRQRVTELVTGLPLAAAAAPIYGAMKAAPALSAAGRGAGTMASPATRLLAGVAAANQPGSAKDYLKNRQPGDRAKGPLQLPSGVVVSQPSPP